jgi:hypothetical protein
MRNLKPYLPVLCLLISCLAYLYWLLGDVVFHPNTFIIMNNTDGRQILFNTYFHTVYGRGLTLSNQLFPNFDVLFMTDAQASVSVLLNTLHRWGLPVAGYVVGITNGLILYSIPLAAVYVYGAARLLGIRAWMSAWGAFFIIALSPQWLRVVCGHAGLAYLIYIPALMYSVLYWASPKQHSSWVFVSTLCLVIFIGFNNGYMLLSGLAFLGLFSVVYIIQTRQWRSKPVLYPLIVVLIAGIGLGLIKKISDPVHDRETAPFGFLDYHAIPETVLLPAHGMVVETLNKILPIPVEQGQEEGAAYVGLFTLFVLMATGIYFIVRLIRRRPFKLSANKALNSLLLTAILLLFYAMALPFRWGMEHLLDVFPFIKQFRSPGRFAWLFYYVFTVYALYRFELWRRSTGSSKIVFTALMILFTMGYVLDIQGLQTWNMRYIHAGGYTTNYFLPSAEKQQELQTLGIDTLHTAAMLGLPLNCAWNSKFERGDEAYDITQRLVELSCASGIPWLTAKLSRASTFNTLRSGQWGANPIIEREPLPTWPKEKTLLLVHQKNYTPTEGENYLRQKGELIFTDSLFDYYRVPINENLHQYRNFIVTHFDSLYQQQTSWQGVQFGLMNEWLYSNRQQEKTLLKTKIRSSTTDTLMEFSVWTRIDNQNENMPTLQLKVFNQQEQLESEYAFNAHTANDYQYGLLRYVCYFPVSATEKIIQVTINNGGPFAFTRWMLRPIHQTVLLQLNGVKTYNGYLLQRPLPR